MQIKGVKAKVAGELFADLDPRPPLSLPSPEELLQPPPAPPALQVPTPPLPETPTPPGDDVTVVVDRFEVVGSTVFSEAELQAALAPFVGRLILTQESGQVI